MAPETYTHGHHSSVLRSHRWRTAENSAAYLLGHLRPGLDLLDVGCGAGTITVDLAQRVAPGMVAAVDSAPAAVAATKSAADAVGVALAVEPADAYHLPFGDDSFDVVHAHQVLQHLGDPVAALAEWRRVCRRGGIVAVRDADYAAMSWWPLDVRLDRWLELYSQAARANHGEPDAARHLLGWAGAAGFAVDAIQVSASAWCFATPGDRGWWADTWAERVTSSALAEQLTTTGLSTAAELAGIADAWRQWAVAADGWFAVVHGELICSVG
ncbi:MAG: methyltransferase domain-containing protein [Ilumatobacteraceae bacterium]